MKTLTLLGAGASHEAGLPISVELTRRIAAEVEKRYWYEGTVQALHAIIGAIIAHDTGRGGDAFEGVDVERVFAAVQMLAHRNELEIAPFVTAWNGSIDSASAPPPTLPSFWERDFREAITKSLGQNRISHLGQVFTEGVGALVGRHADQSEVLFHLRNNMLTALRGCLVVDPEKVDYLAPLLGDGSDVVDIVTLNYDNSIELLCNRADRVVDTGADLWDGSYSWKWSSTAQVRLLKMHGSLDWMLQTRGARNLIQTTPVGANEIGTWSGAEPAIVFGQGSKLRADGPFLGMLVEFERLLAAAERLVVVGYSFRDDHVNEVIVRWLLSGGETHRVFVVNPAIDEWRRDPRKAPLLFQRLEAGRREGRTANNAEPPKVHPSVHIRMPFGAGEGLLETFGEGPSLHGYAPPPPPDPPE